MKIPILRLLLVCSGGWLFGADTPFPTPPPGLPGIPPIPLDAKAAPDPKELRIKMWDVSYDTYRGPGREPLTPEEAEAAKAPADARPWLEANGVVFGPGEEAIYNGALKVLVVRGTGATLDQVDALGLREWTRPPDYVERVEIALVEFSSAKIPELNGEIPYDTLRKAAGDSWHVLNRMQVMTKSGQRVQAISRAGTPKEKPTNLPVDKDAPRSTARLLAGEFGATLDLEPVLAPDGRIIDMNLEYHYRAAEAPGWDWESVGSVTVKAGIPTLLQLGTVPADGDHSQPAKLCAMIVRVDVIPVTLEKSNLRPSPQPGSPVPPPAPPAP